MFLRISIIISFFLLQISSCKKDELSGDNAKYVGTWYWESTSGGIIGETKNSQTEGYSLKLEINENGKYKLYKNNKRVEYGRLQIQGDGTIKFVNDGIKKSDDILENEKILSFQNNTIQIGVSICCDTFISTYQKK